MNNDVFYYLSSLNYSSLGQSRLPACCGKVFINRARTDPIAPELAADLALIVLALMGNILHRDREQQFSLLRRIQTRIPHSMLQQLLREYIGGLSSRSNI